MPFATSRFNVHRGVEVQRDCRHFNDCLTAAEHCSRGIFPPPRHLVSKLVTRRVPRSDGALVRAVRTSLNPWSKWPPFPACCQWVHVAHNYTSSPYAAPPPSPPLQRGSPQSCLQNTSAWTASFLEALTPEITLDRSASANDAAPPICFPRRRARSPCCATVILQLGCGEPRLFEWLLIYRGGGGNNFFVRKKDLRHCVERLRVSKQSGDCGCGGGNNWGTR